MADISIEPSQLQGSLNIPSSKSHTMRAILFAALAKGISRVEQFLPSPDTVSMVQALRMFGAKIHSESFDLVIQGFNGTPQIADDIIQCGNSGQVLRFIGALAGLCPQYTVLTGDHSIRRNRPVQPLLDGLTQLGATAFSSRGDGYAPIIVKGALTKNKAVIDGQDSQPVSGLLIAAAFARHPIEITVVQPGEKPWIDLTLDWFRRMKIPCLAKNHMLYQLEGSTEIEAFTYRVPGDFSSAAYPIAAALITSSAITLHNIDMNDIQGDKAIISVLEKMGARFEIDRMARTLKVEKNQYLKGITIDINDYIDALPILAVLGCFAEGRTQIVNGSIARKKESDRIAAITRELKKMNAQIEERPDGLIIYRSTLHGAELDTFDDHRIALSLSTAALAAQSPSVIRNIDCSAKSYSSFYEDLRMLGAKIQR